MTGLDELSYQFKRMINEQTITGPCHTMAYWMNDIQAVFDTIAVALIVKHFNFLHCVAG